MTARTGSARTGSARPSLTATGLGWLPISLAVVAEAAWISILAALVQEFALRGQVIGLGGMVAFVALGLGISRAVARRRPGSWAVVAPLTVAAAAAAGWLIDPAARGALAEGRLVDALASNPGGLAAGLALLRGFAYGGGHLAFETVGRVVFLGLPGLGILAAIGGMVADPWRSEFLANATVDAVAFVAFGLLALAFAGFGEVERSTAPTWRGNPTWIGLLLVTVAVLVATAVPIAALAGPTIVLTIELILGVLLVPFLLVGLLFSGGAGLRRLVMITAVGVFIVWLLSLATRSTPAATQAGGAGGVVEAIANDRTGLFALGLLAVAIVVVVVAVLARAWLRRRPGDDLDDAREERSFDLPEPVGRVEGKGWSHGFLSGSPRSAAEAYRHLLADLSARPLARRAPSETPTEHARRLRVTGAAGGSDGSATRLELLAADYCLERFGRAELSDAETRRAIDRWRSLRRRLGRGGPSIVAVNAEVDVPELEVGETEGDRRGRPA